MPSHCGRGIRVLWGVRQLQSCSTAVCDACSTPLLVFFHRAALPRGSTVAQIGSMQRWHAWALHAYLDWLSISGDSGRGRSRLHLCLVPVLGFRLHTVASVMQTTSSDRHC